MRALVLQLLARAFARRVRVQQFDRVAMRDIWIYEWRGREWLAHDRFGWWMDRHA